MMRKILLIVALTGGFGAANAQTPARQKQLPDLAISSAAIIKDSAGAFAAKLTVTVINTCGGAASASYVRATFKESTAQNAKTLYFAGAVVRALRGGESFTQVFDLAGKKIAPGAFVQLEADPYKKVAESVEDNNWLTLNPNASGYSSTAPDHCKTAGNENSKKLPSLQRRGAESSRRGGSLFVPQYKL